MERGEIIHGDAKLFARLYAAHVEVYLSDSARSHFGDAAQMASYITDLFLQGAAARSESGYARAQLPQRDILPT